MRGALAYAASGLIAAGALLFALGGPSRGTAGEVVRDAAAAGSSLFARMGCGGCHRLAAAGSSGGAGPALDGLLPSYDARSLRAKIVDPYRAGTADDFPAMPQDFGARMSDRELDDLVAFLLGTTRR